MDMVRFRVSRELLAQAMSMPKGTRILWVYEDLNFHKGPLYFVVEHEDFPDVTEGALIPETTPVLSRQFLSGDDRPESIETITWDWGIKQGVEHAKT